MSDKSQTTDRWPPIAFLALGMIAGSGLTIAFLPFQIFITVVQR
jgi:hypothetical protein